MSKPRVQTPGAEPLPDAGADAGTQLGGDQSGAGGAREDDEPPPDVQRLIDQRVEQKLAQARQAERRAKIAPSTGEELPSQEEVLKRVQADPKHRAILSRDGWVTAAVPPAARDESGFAKA